MGKKKSPKGPKNQYGSTQHEVIKPEFPYEGFEFQEYHDIIQKPFKPIQKAPEPFKPMKNRMFGQNYKPLISEDKYYKNYDLVIQDEESFLKCQEKIESCRLEYDSEFYDLITSTNLVSCQMESRIEKDLRSFSRKCKDVLFRVQSFGEDFDQILIHYAINGKYYVGRGQIHFPEFEYGQLQ